MTQQNDEALKALDKIQDIDEYDTKLEACTALGMALIDHISGLRQALEAQAVDVGEHENYLLKHAIEHLETMPESGYEGDEEKTVLASAVNKVTKHIRILLKEKENITTPPETVDLDRLKKVLPYSKKEEKEYFNCYLQNENYRGYNQALNNLKKYAGKTIKIKEEK